MQFALGQFDGIVFTHMRPGFRQLAAQVPEPLPFTHIMTADGESGKSGRIQPMPVQGAQ